MERARLVDVTQKAMITLMPGCGKPERNVEVDRILLKHVEKSIP